VHNLKVYATPSSAITRKKVRAVRDMRGNRLVPSNWIKGHESAMTIIAVVCYTMIVLRCTGVAASATHFPVRNLRGFIPDRARRAGPTAPARSPSRRATSSPGYVRKPRGASTGAHLAASTRDRGFHAVAASGPTCRTAARTSTWARSRTAAGPASGPTSCTGGRTEARTAMDTAKMGNPASTQISSAPSDGRPAGHGRTCPLG
jgi:hypothetical protein